MTWSVLLALSEFPNGMSSHILRLSPPLKGETWLGSGGSGGYGVTLYNHTIKIDDHTCTNSDLMREGAWPPGVLHPGGSNVLFSDGHVNFIKVSISTPLWRALGTMNGRDLVDSGQL